MKISGNHFTQGGQTQLHMLRMLSQVVGATFKVSLSIAILAFALLVYLDHCWQDFWLVTVYGKAWFMTNCPDLIANLSPTSVLYTTDGSPRSFTNTMIIHSSYMAEQVKYLSFSCLKKLLQGLLLGIVGSGLLSWFWTQRGKDKQQTKILSGSSLVKPEQLVKLLESAKLSSNIKIASVPYVLHSETEHTLIVGTTGCGKTNAMNELLVQIRANRGKAVIVDTTGAFVERFYNPRTDTLLNPLDERSKPWNLWLECEKDYLFDNFAECVIPQVGNDPFWATAARTVLTTAAQVLKRQKNYDIQELLRLTIHGSLKEVFPYFKNTAAASMMDPEAEKTALSIRATLAASIKSFAYLIAQTKVDSKDKNDIPNTDVCTDPLAFFSIRDWVQSPNQRGFLFLNATPEQRSTLAPLITAWLSLATKALMGRRDYEKLWFFVDELASLNKLPDLPKALAEVRKYGGSFVLGLQTLSQIDEIYGQNTSRIITGLTSTKLIFRTPDSYTAKRMSEFLGEQEIMESQESISFGAHQMRDGVSLSDQKRKQPLINYTEIMQLPNLSAYLQLPQDFPITKVAFKYLELPVMQSAFVEKDFSEQVHPSDYKLTNVVEVQFARSEPVDAELPKIVMPKVDGEENDNNHVSGQLA
jgi:type IV conjugative transfer system coupling protein TraD